MIYFNNDYAEGCHPKVLEALIKTNMEQAPGYGTDDHCRCACRLSRISSRVLTARARWSMSTSKKPAERVT